MKITQVMVEFEKRVNDGDYGSEKATAQYVALVDEGEDPDDVVRQLVSRGREHVIVELKTSETLAVRRRLNPPKRVCSECGDELGDEDSYEHEVCREKRRAERALVGAAAADVQHQIDADGHGEDSPF